MNYLKILLLLIVVPAQAQISPLVISDTLQKREQYKYISLPDRSGGPLFGRNSILVTSDSAYKMLFHDSIHHKLPVIDFDRYELISRSSCIRCLTVCNGKPGCHRDACRYLVSWILAEKNERTPVQPVEVSGCELWNGYEELRVFTDDSTFRKSGSTCRKVDFTKNMVLSYRTFADCNAFFRHEFFLDSVQQCLVWRLFEGRGICAGGFYHQFTFETAKLPENYTVVFEKYPIIVKRR